MVIVSQQYFLYRLAILIPITTDSIPATARHPPQISILIIQYTTPAMTRLDNPLLICAASFPVCIIQPAMVCVNVAIASKNTTQSCGPARRGGKRHRAAHLFCTRGGRGVRHCTPLCFQPAEHRAGECAG